MATHSSTPAWKIPWTEEPRRLRFTGSQELDMTVTKPPPQLKVIWTSNVHSLSSLEPQSQLNLI